MSSEIVVVGGGLGGLSAAIAAACDGHSVRLLEGSSSLGGKAGTVVLDGVEVDTGPSVLTMPDVFDTLLRRAGTSLAEEAPIFQPTPACRYHFVDGLTVDLFSSRDETRASVAAALGSTAAHQLDAFLDHARKVWDSAAPWFIYRDAPSPTGVIAMGPAAWRDLTRVDAFRTMDRAIEVLVKEPRLRWILRRYATYNGSDPRTAPGTLNCIAHVELGLGVYGVEGGIASLVRALARVATRLGVEIETGARVERITTQGGRVTGVVCQDGAVHAAQAVIANADARHVLVDLLPKGTRHGLPEEPVPSTSGWVGIVRARRRAERVPHAVLFPNDYAHEFIDLFDHDRPPVDPTVYLCAQERAHHRTGWADAEPLFIMANAPAEPATGARPSDGGALKATVEGRLRKAGLIGPEDAVVWERSARELAAQFPGTRGAIYGGASNDRFAAFRRPPNRVSSVPGLYLASGSAHPGGGMPLCVLSGVAAARAVAEDLGKAR